MRSRLPALCCASATLVATLATALFTAHVSYACSMTGRRQSHCCCAPAEAQQGEAPVSRVLTPCCERTIDAVQGPDAVQHRDASPPIAWAPGPLLAVVADERPRDMQPLLRASVARGPPNGPPVYVRTCRYLI